MQEPGITPEKTEAFFASREYILERARSLWNDELKPGLTWRSATTGVQVKITNVGTDYVNIEGDIGASESRRFTDKIDLVRFCMDFSPIPEGLGQWPTVKHAIEPGSIWRNEAGESVVVDICRGGCVFFSSVNVGSTLPIYLPILAFLRSFSFVAHTSVKEECCAPAPEPNPTASQLAMELVVRLNRYADSNVETLGYDRWHELIQLQCHASALALRLRSFPGVDKHASQGDRKTTP